MIDNTQNFSVRNVLEALKVGKPIGGEAGGQVLSSSYKRAIAPIIRSVLDAQSNGLIGKRDVFWVYGRPGNGKTQTLKQFTHVIPTRRAVAKFAYVVIDLDKRPEAQTSGSLASAIVRSTLSSRVIDDIEKVQSSITKNTPITEDDLSFGIDVISELAQIPALKLFLEFGMPRLLQFFRSRESFIKNILRKQWGDYPDLLRLLTAWLQYTIKPIPEQSEKFDILLKDLATHGVLFPTFKFALEKAGYSTLVIILDEVKNITVDSLKPIWDPDDDEESKGLNLIFVLSAQERVINEIRANETLDRRFFRTPNGIISLLGPEIKEHGKDDIEHVVFTIDKLLVEYPEYRSTSEINLESTIRELRDKFLNQNKTWQDLWQETIKKLTNLT